MLKNVKIGIVLVLSLISICGKAQQAKSWTDGPLTMSDFKLAGPEAASFADTSSAFFTLVRENKVVKTKGVTYKYQDVNAAFLKDRSWVKEGFMSAALLQKHQIEFDILQYYANMYREDYLFYEDTDRHRFEEWFDGNKGKLSESDYLDLYKHAVDEFRRTGDVSAYPVTRTPFDITQHPYNAAKAAQELHVALVGMIPIGDLGRVPEITHMAASVGYGYTEGKNYFNSDLTFAALAFMHRCYINVNASYGRILFSQGRTAFSLFGGLGYSTWKEDTIFTPSLAGGPTLTQGLCVDVSLHKTLNFLSEKPQEREQKVRVRLYMDETYVISQRVISPTVNLSVGFNFGFRALTRP